MTRGGIIRDFEDEFALGRLLFYAVSCLRMVRCLCFLQPARTRGTYTTPNKVSLSDVPTIASVANSDLIPTTPSAKWASNRENVSGRHFERFHCT